MPDATWPTSVPAEPEAGSYSEEIVSNLGAVTLGGGIPSSTRRAAVRHTRVAASWLLTVPEMAALQAFFTVDLIDGSKPFTWLNPAHEATGRYLMDPENPPRWSPVGYGALYKLDLSILKLN